MDVVLWMFEHHAVTVKEAGASGPGRLTAGGGSERGWAMAERTKRKQPPGTDDEPLTPEQIARREIASEDLRWLAELLRRVRDKAEREMAEAEARGEVVRRYKIILRSHFPPRPREQCDPGNHFVVDSASGFWDGQGWTRHLEQALHFHDGEDPWAEARAVADELTRRGTPAEVSFVDPEKPEETPEEAQERIRREAE